MGLSHEIYQTFVEKMDRSMPEYRPLQVFNFFEMLLLFLNHIKNFLALHEKHG